MRKVLGNPKSNPFRKDHEVKNSHEIFKITHVFEGMGETADTCWTTRAGLYNFNDIVPVTEPPQGRKIQKTPVKHAHGMR